MKSACRMKQWLLLLLCVVMTAGVIAQSAGAAEFTKKCTNLENEGVEYFSQITVMGSDVTRWRENLRVFAVKTGDEKDAAGNYKIVGNVVGMDIEVTDDDTRYSCTINNKGVQDELPTIMSCNSIPVNAIINGVYFLYQPSSFTPPDTKITFMVERDDFSSISKGNVKPSTLGGLHGTASIVALPPTPCARNILERDFEAEKNKSLVLYTDKDCNDKSIADQVMKFLEKYDYKNKYSIVNIMYGDYIVKDRIRLAVSPTVDFDYVLELEFGYGYDESTGWYSKKADGSYCTTDQATCDVNRMKVTYSYVPNTSPVISPSLTGAITDFTKLKNEYLPMTLLGGSIKEVNKKGSLKPDWAGNVPFPTSVNFDIKFWYENDTGTLGFENSVFHFYRDLNFKFAKTCSETATSTALYDYCLSSTQPFLAKYPQKITVYDGTAQTGKRLYYGRDKKGVEKYFDLGKTPGETTVNPKDIYDGIFKSQTDPIWASGDRKDKKAEFEFWFMTWKCVDAACDWTTSTSAYPAQLVMSDGGGSSRTFSNAGGGAGSTALTRYVMSPYYDTNRPFAIKEMVFAAPEPGTYVIYTFVDYDTQHNKTVPDPAKYWKKIYVTVNETDDIFNCYSRANNGYFKAWWNDCLSPSETQLIRFEHILNTEEAWIINDSAVPVDYPFVAEFSYLPQKLEVASLNCKFEARNGSGRPGDGYCSHYNIHVPPYTKVTVTGGTMYMSGYPKYDEYRAAYVREDTLSISHLIFSIGVEQCEKKKIPDTGLSLRSPMSPLKINEKVNGAVDPATGFVFTGNSLRIPAIGLGMETPIPIVHVYYENSGENVNNMAWDLSTLGNYVGELEGGSYLPYEGNSVLTGHYYSAGVFKNLEHLNYEDEIVIFGNDGNKYTYSVVQKFITQPDEVYEMFQQIGDRSLTLVTCENYNLVTNEYERRQIIRAAIKSVEPYVENW